MIQWFDLDLVIIITIVIIIITVIIIIVIIIITIIICIENIVISIIKTNLETGLMTGSLGGQLLQNNNHFNANSSVNGIIFIMAGFSFAVIWSENGCYLFDSHSRDINGFPSPITTSFLLTFG